MVAVKLAEGYDNLPTRNEIRIFPMVELVDSCVKFM
jgi:hypothetical protein